MKYFFAALAAVVLISLPSQADFIKGSQTVVIYGGQGGSSTQYDYNPGDRRSVTGGGGAFGAQYLYYVAGTPALAVGADITSSLNGNGHSDQMLEGIETTARLKSLVGLVMARLAYPRGPYRPYLFAGVGAHNSSQQLSGQPVPGFQWANGGTDNRILVDERETSAAVGYGIGMDLFPEDRFFMGVELRAVWLAGLNTDDTAALRAAGFTADHNRGVMQGNLFFRAGYKF